jgi:hypothetical protein
MIVAGVFPGVILVTSATATNVSGLSPWPTFNCAL